VSAVFASLILMAATMRDRGMALAQSSVKRATDMLALSVAWIACHMELLYLELEDGLCFVHRTRRFNEQSNGTVADIGDDNESELLFGFKVTELQVLLLHWRIPANMYLGERSFHGEEAMLIFLHCIRTGTPFARMASSTFGGDPERFSHHMKGITNHLHDTFCHKISGDSVRQWVPFVNDFRSAIWQQLSNGLVNERRADGSDINYEVCLSLHSFRIFGWLDDTALRTDRPRAGRINEDPDGDVLLQDTQQAFYK
jgi:hypothetical protein